MKLYTTTRLKPSNSLNGKHLECFQQKLIQVKGLIKKTTLSERKKGVDVERNNGSLIVQSYITNRP